MTITFIACKKIWTGTGNDQSADALLFSPEGIIAVGPRDQLRSHPMYGQSRKADLGDGIVVPGLSDCHLHLLAYAKQKLFVDLSKAQSQDDVLAALAERVQRAAPDEWVCGFNLDETSWPEPTLPDRRTLDALGIPNPVLVQRVCTHATILNTEAMRRSGLLEAASFEGVLSGEDDTPNGILVESAQATAHSRMGGETFVRQKLLEVLSHSLQECASYGLTTLFVCGATSLGMEERMDLYQALRTDGRLTARIFAYHDMDTVPTVTSGFGDRWIAYQGYKLFLDGSLGARTAALSKAYADAPQERGMLLHDTAALTAKLKELDVMACQALVHAIGDAALDQLLDAAEGAEARQHKEGRKLPILVNHCMICRPDQVTRMRRLGVAATVQPTFVPSDRTMTPARLGDRIDRGWAYPWRSLTDAGIRLNGSSDSPIESLDPWLGIRAAVTRHTREGVWMPEQRLSVAEALCMYTVNPAVNSGSNEWRGTLEAGKEADFAVLDTDIFACSEDRRADARVQCTVVGGRSVYGELKE